MHPELLNLTVRACREYMAVGDCHGEAPPTERLIATVVQLADQLSPVPDCTEPNRAVCPRLCIDFCNKAETEREFCAVRRALELACDGDKGKAMEFLRAADGMGPSAGARPLSEWHEDDGPVTWWKFPVDEPAWIGTPNSSDWPGYHTHWTPHPPMPLGVKGDGNG